MINYQQIWKTGLSVYWFLGSRYGESMNEAAREYGLEPPNWYLLTASTTFKPDPTSVQRLRVKFPYGSTRYYDHAIQSLLDTDLLVESPLDGYSLTEKGDEATQSIMSAAYNSMAELPVLTEEKMRSLAISLGRLVQTCMTFKSHISKWSIIHSRRLDQSQQDNFTAKIDQYLSDLDSYRDDCHLASWGNFEVNGHAWDVFSLIWKEETSSFESISERLVNKKWTKEETYQAIEDLREIGWVEGATDLTLTDSGTQVRNEAEDLTNKYFFAPWNSVSASDMETISTLLLELKDRLSED